MLEDADPTVQRIARRVSTLRREQGLSLEALAERSGVSRSMISLIERGQSSPTATVLERLASALGVVLASLFDDAAAPATPLHRRADQAPWKDPATGYVLRNLSPPNHPSPMQVVEVELPPRAAVTYDNAIRERTIHQQVVVLDGVVNVSSGEHTHRLEAGDCLAMTLDRPSGFHNPGRRTARYIVIVSR